MTYVERLPFAFEGDGVDDLPIYQVDPIVAAGTLALVEPATSWDAGVPVSGATIPNIAAPNAVAQGYPGDNLEWINTATWDGVKGLLERSGVGGVHVINSRTTALTSGTGAGVVWPTWLAQHIIDNPAHEYAMSLWMRVTREYTGAAERFIVTNMADSTGTAGAFSAPYIGPATGVPVGAALSSRGGAPNTANGFAGMVANKKQRMAMHFGRYALLTEAAPTSGFPSYVAYRVTFDDLTLSNRTLTAFQAADQALFDAAFASGGRYESDTYTDPATIP